MSKLEGWQLAQRQNLPLEVKIKLSKLKILAFEKMYEGKIYVSYSGGKDSEVLLHLVKSVIPSVKVVFVDNGMELDTRDHAIKKADVVLRPKYTSSEIWNKYGIPFPSKQQAHYFYQIKNTKSVSHKNRLLTGYMKDGSKTQFKLSNKWKPLLDTEIRLSDACCKYLKRDPINKFNKETGFKGIIGTMASDSSQRKKIYLQNGCINIKKEICTPLGFWLEQDILQYIKLFNVDYCRSAYGEIIEDKGILKTTLAKRTGCVNCLFGIHLEETPNRLQRLSLSDPKMHSVFLNNWCNGNIKKILEMYNIPYTLNKEV